MRETLVDSQCAVLQSVFIPDDMQACLVEFGEPDGVFHRDHLIVPTVDDADGFRQAGKDMPVVSGKIKGRGQQE